MNEEQIRAEFEDWWKRTLLIKHELSIREIITYCERSSCGDYVHSGTALRWDGWKAAIAQVFGEPVAEVEVRRNRILTDTLMQATSPISDGRHKLYAPKEKS